MRVTIHDPRSTSHERRATIGRFISFIFILTFSLALISSFGASTISCSGGATPGGLKDLEKGGGGGEGGGAAGGGGGGGGGEGSGGGEIMPPVSIPAPSLTKGDKTLVAAADSNGNIPVVLFDGAVPPDYTEGNHVLVVSNEEVVIASSGFVAHRTGDESSFVFRPSSLVVAAHATSITVPPPVTEVCGKDGVTCCAITNESPFECFHPGTNDDTLNIYVMDTRIPVTISGAHEEMPNPQVLWMRESVKDVIKGPTIEADRADSDVVLALTSDKVVTINNMGRVLSDGWALGDERDFQVIGEFEDNYQHPGIAEGGLADGAKELAFDPSDDKLAFRKRDQVRTDHPDMDTGLGRLLDEPLMPIATASIPDTVDYTKLKYAGDNKLRFVREPNGVALNEKVFMYNTPSPDDIQFFAPGDIEGVAVKKTLAFDVDQFSPDLATALVVFDEYQDGEPRGQMIKMASNIGIPPRGGESPLDGDHDFKDLVIYQQQRGNNPETDQGKALLVDASNNSVWIFSYFFDYTLPRTDHFIQDTLNPETDAILVGPNPQSVVMSADKSKAYVVCQDGEEVYELTLKEGGVLKTVAEINNPTNNLKKVINLHDLIPGKNLTIKPNEITISGDNLLVGTEDLRSAMTVPISMAAPLAPAAGLEPDVETGDGDGSGVAGGEEAEAGAGEGADGGEAGEAAEGPSKVPAGYIKGSEDSGDSVYRLSTDVIEAETSKSIDDSVIKPAPSAAEREPAIPIPPPPPERPAFF